VKRPRRTNATIDGIQRAILDVIRADPPMTVRQVFYQLVSRGVIEKTEGGVQERRQRTTDNGHQNRKTKTRKEKAPDRMRRRGPSDSQAASPARLAGAVST
jgi:hypothetical protein